MPRAILLSPDPKPERILIVTLLIEGEDAFPDDEYVIGSNPPIEFDQFIRKASSIIVNQRTEVAFTSTKGFPCDGQYNIWICKADDEKHRTEMTYELGVKKEAPSAELTAINASTSPDGAPDLPLIATGPVRQLKSKPAVHLVPPDVVVNPEPTQRSTRNSAFGRWMAIIASVALLTITAFIFFNKKEEPPVQTKTTTTRVVIKQDATSEPSALSPTDPKSIEEDDLVETEEEAPKEEALPVPESAKPEPSKVLAPIPTVAKPQSVATPENSAPPKPVMRSIKIEY